MVVEVSAHPSAYNMSGEMSASDPIDLNAYRQMFEQSPVLMALLDGPEHRIAYANPAYHQLGGNRLIIGLPAREVYPEIEGTELIELLDKVYLSGVPFIGRNIEVSLARSEDGFPQKLCLDVIYQPIRNAAGRVTSVLFHGTDVTDASEAADTLRDKQTQLEIANADLERMVVERSLEPGTTWRVSPHLLSVIDMRTGRFLRVNPSWATLLGWESHDIIGKPYVDFVHPEDLTASFAAFEEVRQGLPVLNFENRYRAKSGGYEWLSWVAVPHDDKVYSTTRVITGDKEQALALTKAEDALRQSQKMEAIGQLTGGIAHDFNNMLSVIISGVNLIERRRTRDEPIDDVLAAVHDAARRAADFTRGLMAFSRQLPLNPKNVDVAVMVKSMSEILGRSLGESITIETVVGGGLWMARTDVNQLENAILNLALNARDAMPDGGKLTIETSNAHLDDEYARSNSEVFAGQYVMVAISDSGTGMPPDVVERAFEPFFSTKEVGKGTGLGLSQVFGYVKQSRGHIKIYSEVGHGTSAKMYLPRAVLLADAEPIAPLATATPSGSQHEVILLVEDDQRMREITIAALKELGYAVLSAASGSEALETLKANSHIGLLFTDIVMPGMSGRRLATEALKLQPTLRILFTTGYTPNTVVDNGMLDAGVSLLPKPFTLDQLGKKIREVLS